MNLKYSEFKQLINEKNLYPQKIETSDTVYLEAYDGNFKIKTKLDKDDEENYPDFQLNLESSCNEKIEKRGESGHLIFAPTFEDDMGLTGTFRGHLFKASPNTLNIYDIPVSSEMKLRGGWYQLFSDNTNPTANIGDYIEFSVIDKDDVLGLFSSYGVPEGGFLELSKFVNKDYVNPYDNSRQDFRVSGGSTVYSGLFLRVFYMNTGTQEVDFGLKVYSHDS